MPPAFLLTPYRMIQNNGHLQMTATYALPLFFWALDRAARDGLRAIGVHPSTGLGHAMRWNLAPGEPETMQPVIFIDRFRQRLTEFFWKYDRAPQEVQ